MAKGHPELSKLLGYVFDHREVLVASKAGDLARGLNYKKEGRDRKPNYSTPRVSYFQNENGEVQKIRIYELEAVLGEEDEATLGAAENIEVRVLEVSVDGSGKAVVSLLSLSD